MIAIGTVGWAGDDPHFEKDQDGYTLVKVTLFAGRKFTKPMANPKVAEGHKILCHISGGLFRIPPVGTRVHVSIPDGMENSVGAGCIIATIEPTVGIDQHEDDRVVLTFGPDTHIVLAGKSVTIQDADNQFMSVGIPRSGGDAAIMIQCADGTGMAFGEGKLAAFVADGGEMSSVIQMTNTSLQLIMKDTGFLTLGDQQIFMHAPTIKVNGAGVYLGKTPTALQGVAYNPPGLGPTVTGASPSVFVSIL